MENKKSSNQCSVSSSLLRHAPDAREEMEREGNDVDDGEVLEQDIHILADDVAAGIDDSGENGAVHLRLPCTLFVLQGVEFYRSAPNCPFSP